MKLKHWQGYGCLNAKKLKKTADTLVVEVWGNHEYGIEVDPYDKMRVFEWLVRRFDKTRKDWTEIESFATDDFYVEEGVVDVEHCVYTIKFREAA